MIGISLQTNFTNVSSQEMVPKKPPVKSSRKDTAREGSSAAPQEDVDFDRHRFWGEEHQRWFEAIKSWSFLKERRVQLRDGEYVEFQEEIAQRQWTQLVSPMAKYDPEIVIEFYANAWPTKEGVKDKHSWVRGQWIPSMRMPLTSFWGIHWSWRKASTMSLARGGVRPLASTMRLLTSCYAFRGRIFPRA